MEEELVWILMPRGKVPPRWVDRSRDMSLVPLVPKEARELLRSGSVIPGLTEEEERIGRLLAEGRPVGDIARQLHMTERSVYRRLARMRRVLGASSVADLGTKLAHYGF